MSLGIFKETDSLVEFFNENIAKPAGVAPIALRNYIPVDTDDDTEYPITVWRKLPATEFHQGENEDGFRWKTVYNGIPHRPTYKPF